MPVPRGDFQQIGSTGLYTVNNRLISDIHELPELRGRRGLQIFQQMAEQDPIIGAVLFTIDMLIRQVDWVVNPATDSPEDKAIAEQVESNLYDMSTSWPDTISEILSFLPYGWSLVEIVYKLRGGDTNDPTQRSRYNDGKIGWRKLAIRPQETLFGWEFDEDGGVQAMLQQAPPRWDVVTIPIDKALLFRTKARKGSPEGPSVLRSAYRAWYFRRNIENIEAIGIERDLAGLPIIEVPDEYLLSDATPAQQALIQDLVKLVTSIRRDEQEGVIMPQRYDSQGHPLFNLKLLTSGGQRQQNTDAVIARYDQRMAMTVLADFILLGHENVGSKAMVNTRTDLFATAITAWLDSMCGVFNAHAIPRLMRLNGIDLDHMPELGHGNIQPRDLTALAAYITALAHAGMPLFPNPELERNLLEAADLPAPVNDDNSDPPIPTVASQQPTDAAGQPTGQDQPQTTRQSAAGQAGSAAGNVTPPSGPTMGAESLAALLTTHHIAGGLT